MGVGMALRGTGDEVGEGGNAMSGRPDFVCALQKWNQASGYRKTVSCGKCRVKYIQFKIEFAARHRVECGRQASLNPDASRGWVAVHKGFGVLVDPSPSAVARLAGSGRRR